MLSCVGLTGKLLLFIIFSSNVRLRFLFMSRLPSLRSVFILRIEPAASFLCLGRKSSLRPTDTLAPGGSQKVVTIR